MVYVYDGMAGMMGNGNGLEGRHVSAVVRSLHRSVFIFAMSIPAIGCRRFCCIEVLSRFYRSRDQATS